MMKITIKDGWFQVHRGARAYFALHLARRVMWRSFNGSKYHAVDFPWFDKEQA